MPKTCNNPLGNLSRVPAVAARTVSSSGAAHHPKMNGPSRSGAIATTRAVGESTESGRTSLPQLSPQLSSRRIPFILDDMAMADGARCGHNRVWVADVPRAMAPSRAGPVHVTYKPRCPPQAPGVSHRSPTSPETARLAAGARRPPATQTHGTPAPAAATFRDAPARPISSAGAQASLRSWTIPHMCHFWKSGCTGGGRWFLAKHELDLVSLSRTGEPTGGRTTAAGIRRRSAGRDWKGRRA